MAITVAEFETVLGEIRTAITAGDWPTARTKALEARVVASGLPFLHDFDGAKVQIAVDLLKGLEETIADAQAGDAEDEDVEQRFINTRVSHGW